MGRGGDERDHRDRTRLRGWPGSRARYDDVAVWTITAALLELELTAEIRRAAAILQPTAVRSLDAIHIATATSLKADLAGLLTFDVRMQQAGSGLGLAVVAPR
jgi:predicted nucleic acid-binding protein